MMKESSVDNAKDAFKCLLPLLCNDSTIKWEQLYFAMTPQGKHYQMIWKTYIEVFQNELEPDLYIKNDSDLPTLEKFGKQKKSRVGAEQTCTTLAVFWRRLHL